MGRGKGLRDEQLAPWPRTKYAVKEHRREYYALITHMDTQIGKILSALDQSGKAESTMIIFTADQGLAVGHHGLMGKQNMFEHSLRPPLIVAGPGIPHDQRIDIPVYLQDVMPTTLELAGVSVPQQVEFKSLLPLIRGERRFQYDAISGAYRPKMQRMILENDFKLIYYPAIDKTLLFHLTDDPFEMHDLADQPQYAARCEEMARKLHQVQHGMQDPLSSQD